LHRNINPLRGQLAPEPLSPAHPVQITDVPAPESRAEEKPLRQRAVQITAVPAPESHLPKDTGVKLIYEMHYTPKPYTYAVSDG